MFFNDSDLVLANKAGLSPLELIDPFSINYDDKYFEPFTDDDLLAEQGGTLLFDTECYENYWLIAFKSYKSKKVIYFELDEDNTPDYQKLAWILCHFLIVGFNSKNYDLLVTTLAMRKEPCSILKQATRDIIEKNFYVSDFEKAYNVTYPSFLDHIDLIEVAPLQASLKLYAGRLHTKRMQEMNIDPDKVLTTEEKKIVRFYCINDLDLTFDLFHELKPALELRYQMSAQYGQDLRSRSDAQIAEHVLTSELKRINGYISKRPEIKQGTVYHYQPPKFLQYESPQLQRVLEVVCKAPLVVGASGYIESVKEIEDLRVEIGESIYRLGLGGLHSSETCVSHVADENTLLIDKDVASYYPSIILNLELYPKHLGKGFLRAYRDIVDRRLEAKRTGNKIVNQSLKITINGSFGKLGSKWSNFYSPDLIMQVTLTGQLSLLMLIEMVEKQGIPVVSANTDGILVKCPKHRYNYMEAAVIHWQRITGFETEETRYKAIYCRDVNNYIAIKEEKGFKVKGAYTEKGSSGDSVLSKNPEHLICNDAVVEFLMNGTPVETTIRNCKDIRRFVTIRQVKGGAEKSGVYLGKAVRWYYSKTIKGTINYVLSGNKVPNTDNAMPLMELPDELPNDLDHSWYIETAKSILLEIGYGQTNKRQASLF
jgi:hypothetical protein